jgi:ATP-binding cassette subfamily B protein
VPISEVAISSLRDLIALVPQDPFIFEATIMDNIKYSDRYASKEEVIKAAKMADLHKKIMSMPKYYKTILQKDQNNLSIGEQQRVTIARAFLRKSPIMIFDEAFSNLDAETECRIIDSLRRIKNNKTIIIISHRLKSIVFADNIIAIKEGYIIESGSPTELIEKEGVFFEWLKSSPGQPVSSVVL